MIAVLFLNRLFIRLRNITQVMGKLYTALPVDQVTSAKFERPATSTSGLG